MSKNKYIRKEEEIAPNVFRKITHLNGVMMAIIRFENGPMPEADPYHSHPHEQITYVEEGELHFMIEGEKYFLKKGDTMTIESNKKHTIQTLSERVVLVDCFSPIREDFL